MPCKSRAKHSTAESASAGRPAPQPPKSCYPVLKLQLKTGGGFGHDQGPWPSKKALSMRRTDAARSAALSARLADTDLALAHIAITINTLSARTAGVNFLSAAPSQWAALLPLSQCLACNPIIHVSSCERSQVRTVSCRIEGLTAPAVRWPLA